jgi:PqqD family protein of HPr-rel-A system
LHAQGIDSGTPLPRAGASRYAGAMVRIAPHISWHPVEGELALFDTRDGSYHALNSSAAEIWRGLADGVPAPELATSLAAAHRVSVDEVAGSIADFIKAALAKGLLVGD